VNVNGTGNEDSAAPEAAGFGGAKEVSTPANGDAPASDAADPSETGQDDAAADATGSYELPQDLLGEDGALNTEAVTARLRTDAESAAARIEKFGEVPEGDYTIPGEVEIEGIGAVSIDPENPYLKGFMEKGKELGIGQTAMTTFLEDYVQSAAADAKALSTEAAKQVVTDQNNKMLSEFESLGDDRDSRLASLQSTISEQVSPEAATALVNDIRTKASFEAIEGLLERVGAGRLNTEPTGEHADDGELDVANILFPSKQKGKS